MAGREGVGSRPPPEHLTDLSMIQAAETMVTPSRLAMRYLSPLASAMMRCVLALVIFSVYTPPARGYCVWGKRNVFDEVMNYMGLTKRVFDEGVNTGVKV